MCMDFSQDCGNRICIKKRTGTPIKDMRVPVLHEIEDAPMKKINVEVLVFQLLCTPMVWSFGFDSFFLFTQLILHCYHKRKKLKVKITTTSLCSHYWCTLPCP